MKIPRLPRRLATQPTRHSLRAPGPRIRLGTGAQTNSNHTVPTASTKKTSDMMPPARM